MNLQFIKNFTSSSVGLMTVGMSTTIIVFCSYRYVIKPYMDANRRAEAEAIANYIFEKEQKMHNKKNDY